MTARHVIKILRHNEFEAFRNTGSFDGSPDDVRDGFIHLSTSAQVSGTLQRHFTGDDGSGTEALHLLTFDTDVLGTALRWEPSRKGALFPHLYAPLQWADVMTVHAVQRDTDGQPILPPEIT